MPLETWATARNKKEIGSCYALRVASCELRVARYGSFDFGFVISDLGLVSEARYEGRIFEFGKPNKLNQLSQLIQPNKRSELSDLNAPNDINELNHPNGLDDHNHPNHPNDLNEHNKSQGGGQYE